MPEVSAAIIVLAGAVFTVAGVLPSPMTDTSRERLVGIGYLIALLGLIAWLLAVIGIFMRALR